MSEISGRTSSAPLADILAGLGDDTARLLRQEFALAKAEVREDLKTARTGLIELGIAMVAANIALIILSIAAAQWLAHSMDPGWAYLIVGAVWLILAAGLGMAGSRMLQRTEVVPERTTETIKQLPGTLKGQQ
jgi:Putative Actinobacterial Holin-X, holin superfamily III